MKTGIIVATAFWTAVAVWGFWGWAAFCVIAAAAVLVAERRF